MYIAGTIDGLAQDTIGNLDLSDKRGLVFIAGAASAGPRIEMFAWNRVESLTYGDKVSNRWTVVISTHFGAPFNIRRRHFLTIAFEDDRGQPGAVLLELAKGAASSTILVIEARTGRKVRYESQEDEMHLHG